MDNLIIKAKKQTPEICLNAEDGILEFIGKSRPEDALVFYKPVLEWIKQYVNEPRPQTTVIFNLEYFNSSTTKVLKRFLEILRKIKLHGKDIILEWHYQQEDEDMLEVGEELASLYHLPFSFIPYSPD